MQKLQSNDVLVENADISMENSEYSTLNDELTTLRNHVSNLNSTIENLENVISMKETHLTNMRKDCERLSGELKSQQRCNRNLKQQLEEERLFYQREKEHFSDELQRQNSKYNINSSKYQQQRQKHLEESLDALKEENKLLKEELAEKSEVTYNLCIRFLRMKHAKDALRQKFCKLHEEHLKVIEEMIAKLDEARKELNLIASEKFQEPLPVNKSKLLQVVQRNTKLIYENATLRAQIQNLTQCLNNLRGSVTKPGIIKVDTRTVTKLLDQCRNKRMNETKKQISNA